VWAIAPPHPSQKSTHPFTEADQTMLKPMLMRLQTTLENDGWIQPRVLLPMPQTTDPTETAAGDTIDFVVGYTGSPKSQAALDMALWIAHQTRLVKQNPVLVHVVYVADKSQPKTIAKADHILWQARCLASEWRGSLNAHLRVGLVADELSQVATETGATVMLVGCLSDQHKLVQQLAHQIPCALLGLPSSAISQHRQPKQDGSSHSKVSPKGSLKARQP